MPAGVSGVTVSQNPGRASLSSISWFGPPSSAGTIAAVLSQVQTYLTSSVILQLQGLAGIDQIVAKVGATGGSYPVLTADATTQRNALVALLGYT